MAPEIRAKYAQGCARAWHANPDSPGYRPVTDAPSGGHDRDVPEVQICHPSRTPLPDARVRSVYFGNSRSYNCLRRGAATAKPSAPSA